MSKMFYFKNQSLFNSHVSEILNTISVSKNKRIPWIPAHKSHLCS